MGKEEVNNETEVNETFTLPAIWILQLSVTTYNYIGVEMEDDDFYRARLCGLELGVKESNEAEVIAVKEALTILKGKFIRRLIIEVI
ncbi:hypothetical protein AAC387_Pa11g1205 [Persea americana]